MKEVEVQTAALQTVNLDLGEQSYPIYIGEGLLARPELLRPHIAGRQILIVTNETIAPLYLEGLVGQLQKISSDYQIDTIQLPDGERFKTWETLNKIYDLLLEKKHNRGSTIIALGGGVIGDTAGFAAATYQRGIAFIQIPTTLLAQVDSSVGGKTAVNHPLGKNMIGAFYQPRAVLIDTSCLKTLPGRELSAGLAEVIKHAALGDIAYLEWIEANMAGLLAVDGEAMAYAVKLSCEIKAGIVAKDEREQGVRALLNLGHTFGHAIENGLGYGEWLHGEAVGAGMVMAADLSRRLGMLAQQDVDRLTAVIKSAGLPTRAPASVSNQLVELMGRDKKVADSGLRFVLLEQLGKAVLVDKVDVSHLQATIRDSQD